MPIHHLSVYSVCCKVQVFAVSVSLKLVCEIQVTVLVFGDIANDLRVLMAFPGVQLAESEDAF